MCMYIHCMIPGDTEDRKKTYMYMYIRKKTCTCTCTNTTTQWQQTHGCNTYAYAQCTRTCYCTCVLLTIATSSWMAHVQCQSPQARHALDCQGGPGGCTTCISVQRRYYNVCCAHGQAHSQEKTPSKYRYIQQCCFKNTLEWARGYRAIASVNTFRVCTSTCM